MTSYCPSAAINCADKCCFAFLLCFRVFQISSVIHFLSCLLRRDSGDSIKRTWVTISGVGDYYRRLVFYNFMASFYFIESTTIRSHTVG